jgi:hypothetical protein
METLKSEPWNLIGGDLVQIRSTAVNGNGRGAPSPPNTIGARIVADVPVLPVPELIRRTTRTITFSWLSIEDVSGLDITYEVFMQYGEEESTQLGTTSATRFTARNLSPGLHIFKVRAYTECAFSDFSEELQVNLALLPAQMSSPVATVTGCALQIDWIAPNTNGAPILRYNIMM